MRYPSIACAVALILATSACSDPVRPDRPNLGLAINTELPALGVAQPNEDQRLLAAADAVEGFGGFFYDEDGNPTVYLRDPSRGPVADGQLRAMFLGGQGATASGALTTRAIRYRSARYDIRDLARFRTVAANLLARERTAVWHDLDEARNRVTLAVSDAASQRRLVDAIRAAGVPDDAFDVLLESPWVTTAAYPDTILNGFDPIPGGVLINHTTPCTLGFNINWNGHAAFVTASHCTDWFASLQNPWAFGQPSNLPEVGLEVADPAPWQTTSDCVGSMFFEDVDKCRYSDAAIIQVVDTLPNSRLHVGYIARTQGTGSLLINHTNPRWEITGKKTPLYVGETVERMGFQSGWTSSTVQNTCVTQYLNMPHSQRAKLWCQVVVGGSSIGGDSGGPGFF